MLRNWVQRGGPWTGSKGVVHGPGLDVLYTSDYFDICKAFFLVDVCYASNLKGAAATQSYVRRPLACCMLIKAKMAESGDFEDGDLELPEDVDDEGGLIRYYFF